MVGPMSHMKGVLYPEGIGQGLGAGSSWEGNVGGKNAPGSGRTKREDWESAELALGGL